MGSVLKPVPENATLLDWEELSPTLRIFRIRPDAIPPLGEKWFEAGQYVMLGLNVEQQGRAFSVQRAYSVASPPEERRWLELYIRRIAHPETELPFTHLLWARPRGDRLHVGRRFAGRFTLAQTVRPEDPRLRVFVAAGTGLAPFVSIVRSELERGGAAQVAKMVVLHGARHPQELGFREDLELVLNRLSQRYWPTVSRGDGAPGWPGHRGRVETFFDDEKLETLEQRLGLAAGGLTPGTALVYVCGFRGTIAESVVRLISRGFVPDDRRLRQILEVPEDAESSLFFEQYDPGLIIDPMDETLLQKLRLAFPQAGAR